MRVTIQNLEREKMHFEDFNTTLEEGETISLTLPEEEVKELEKIESLQILYKEEGEQK